MTAPAKWTPLCWLTLEAQMDSVTILILFLQAVRLSGHRGRLCFSGLSSEVQPLPPEGTGPELQSSRRKRIEAALCWTGGSTLQTGETQVRICLCFYIPLIVMLLNTEYTSKNVNSPCISWLYNYRLHVYLGQWVSKREALYKLQ